MTKIKRVFATIKDKIKSNPISFAVIVLCSILALLCFCFSINELVFRLNYEMQEIGNYDTYLYYTVGRALAEGLKPYVDMYENKPPLIFLLSALSFKISGGYHLMNYLSMISFVIVLLVPIVFVAIQLYKHKPQFAVGAIVLLFVCCSSTMFMLFSEECSGEVQIEIFGTAASLLAVCFATFECKREKLLFFSPFCILSGFFWGIAIMFKEPFVIIVFVSILLFTHSKKQILTKLVYPLCYAILVCLIIVIASNSFLPYFTIYLNNMFSSHISIYGSPLDRMKNVKIMFDYYAIFSPSLPFIMAMAFALTIFAELNHCYSKKTKKDVLFKFVNIIKIIIALYLASFVVGLGGQYYNHHYVFALCFFLALVMRCCQFAITNSKIGIDKTVEQFKLFSSSNDEEKQNYCQSTLIDEQNESGNDLVAQAQSEEDKMTVERLSMKIIKETVIYVLMILSTIYTCRGFTKTADYVVGTDYVISQTALMKENAKYIDDVLDAVEEEKYLWVGFNGYNPYAFTKHLPMGPCFVQDANNFSTTYGHFAVEFKKQLRNANVIIVDLMWFFDRRNLGSVTDYFNKYLERFTLEQPESVKSLNKPLTFNYVIFYRK